MATAALTDDRVYLFRLQILVIDGGTRVLRNIFNQKLPNQLQTFLANERATINRLKAKHTITQSQCNKLYPQGGQPPNIADFDITLIICLLRSIRSLGLNQKYTWNVTPQPTDTTFEADLHRLKEFRNEVAHVPSTYVIQQASFQAKWTEIEQVLQRLNSFPANPLPNLQQILNSYNNDYLDPAEKTRIEANLREWEEMERSLEQEKQQVKELKEHVDRSAQEIHQVKTELTQHVDRSSQEVQKVKTELTQRVDRSAQKVHQVKTELTQRVDRSAQEVQQVKTELTQRVDRSAQEVQQVKTELKQHVYRSTHEVQQVKTELTQHVDRSAREVQQVKTELKQHVDRSAQEVQKVKTELTQHVDRSAQEVQQVKTELKQHVARSAQEVQQVKTELTQHVDRSAQEVQQVKTELQQHVDRSAQEVQQVETELKQRVDRSDQKVDELTLKFVEVDRRVKVVENTNGKQTAVEEQIAFEELKKNLRNDLKATYRQKYATIQLSPLIEEEDTSLLKFYVMPDINSVKIKRDIGGGKEEKTKIPFCDIFYKDEENKKNRNPYKEIYLMADAGLGKTSFSKRLALTWCQSKDPRDEDKDHFSDEEIEILSGFDFVFLVLLRDSSSECSVEDMIFNQLFPRFGHTGYNKTDLENVLNKERCLVILDGLDEWEHPPNNCTRADKFIPHRANRETTTVLTTTRPWKLSIGGINASQIDQKLEIARLNKTSGNKLKESFISHVSSVKDKDILKKKVDDFNSDLVKKRVSELVVIPILLMFMLCLWCDNKNLGNTLSELYSNIVELMLARTVVKCMNKELPHIPAYTQGDIPHCFTEHENCVKFYSLLMSLGELAFHTLFRETKEENILVFDVSVANRYLSKKSLDFCLKTGLLTQTKDGTKLCKQTRKISFSHKSIQEYFAALYMSSSIDQTSVLETVKSKCKCIKDILEISKILLFISGINADMLSKISHELIRIVNDDEITREYRSSVEEIFYHPLKEYQDLWVSCCNEMSQENQASLCIEDVFMSYSCEQEQYRKNLRFLTTRNQQNIKSVNIYMYRTHYKSAREVIDYFSLTRLDNLEKICYHEDYDSDIAILLKTSVKCLGLVSLSLDSPRLPCKEVSRLNKLEVIDIRMCSLSHSELTEFYNYISRTKCLRKIKLDDLRCTDHRLPSCPGSRLELLQHSQLRTLSLWWIHVTEIEINLAVLEKCKLEVVYDPDPVLKFRNHPAADINLPGNTHVVLAGMKMAASSLCQLVDLIQELPQSVLVEIYKCTIKPEDEFRRQIHRINTSSQFRMLKELEENRYGRKTFQFETIREEH